MPRIRPASRKLHASRDLVSAEATLFLDEQLMVTIVKLVTMVIGLRQEILVGKDGWIGGDCMVMKAGYKG